jgi:hypothetical protein
MTACLGPDMRVVNGRFFHWWHNHGRRLYMHIITGRVLCGFLISTKGSKSNIPWIVRKVLLMAKVEMFPLPTSSRMSDLSIPLSLDMPKQELSFPSIREHMFQTVNGR